jgi:site-specific recombinase XerD
MQRADCFNKRPNIPGRYKESRHAVWRIRRQLGAWSFKSPHVARHTAATTLLEVTGGDVRLVQELLGHANLNTLQGYTKIVDARKVEAYRRYQEFLDSRKAT